MKGYPKLTLQILALATVSILMNLVTETDLWQDMFVYTCNASESTPHFQGLSEEHEFPRTHYSLRAVIYTLTCVTLSTLAIIKIINSHKVSDFK